jgi:hypothetical protein
MYFVMTDASSSAVAKGATRHPVVTTAGAATAAEDPAHAHLAATADSAADPSSATAQQHLLPAAARIAGAEVSPAEQAELRERARQMFYHGYDSYMNNAFPEVSCRRQLEHSRVPHNIIFLLFVHCCPAG